MRYILLITVAFLFLLSACVHSNIRHKRNVTSVEISIEGINDEQSENLIQEFKKTINATPGFVYSDKQEKQHVQITIDYQPVQQNAYNNITENQRKAPGFNHGDVSR